MRHREPPTRRIPNSGPDLPHMMNRPMQQLAARFGYIHSAREHDPKLIENVSSLAERPRTPAHAIGRQRRPSRARSWSASSGPSLPASKSASPFDPAPRHASRNGWTIRQPASIPGAIHPWEFEPNVRRSQVAVGGSFVVNDPNLMLQAAIGGVGIAHPPEMMVA